MCESLQIKVKREETRSIAQFFSKKDTHEQQKAKPESNTVKEEQKSVKNENESQTEVEISKMKDEPFEASLLENVKEEPKSQGNCYESTNQNEDNDTKAHIVSLSPKAANDVIVKRDYEEFSADAKQASAKETGKQYSSPRGKRSKATDKQPTLFSYFGKR